MSPSAVNSKTLCLACSSSLQPSKSTLFITNCCKRPICPFCIASNPRLARYDPCLACLAGVSLLASASKAPFSNLSGEVMDRDTFVLGDDDDDDDDEVANFNSTAPVDVETQKDLTQLDSSSSQEQVTSMPSKYFLNRSDTLQGLSIRFGIDIHEICKLNNLSPNIIRNPNLLHTRASLILPPTANPHPSPISSKAKDKCREAELVRERAVKRLQTLTKEVDWCIAQAYVALADDEHEQEARASKLKEGCDSLGVADSPSLRSTTADTRLESLAIERYLDDLEWEAEEIQAGRLPRLPKFPFGNFGSQPDKGSSPSSKSKSIGRYWWQWSNT